MHRFSLHQSQAPFDHRIGEGNSETIDHTHTCSDIFTRACPQIHVTSFHSNPLKPYLSILESSPQQARGSGFVIKTEGHVFNNDSYVVVTNHHVIDSHQQIECTFPHSGQVKYLMKVVLDDPEKDVALLQFQDTPPEWMTSLPLNDSDTLFNGDVDFHNIELVAVGYPLGGGLKETKGCASGMEYLQGKAFIQTDAALNSGNSGGPCLAYDSQTGQPSVWGINAAIMQGRNTIGYAIPINVVKQCISEHNFIKSLHPKHLIGGVAIRRPFLGLSGFPGIPSVARHYGNNKSGFHVQYVYPGTLFSGENGLKCGDEILCINGRDVNEVGQVIPPWSNTYVPMSSYLSSLPMGEIVQVSGLRKGQSFDCKVKRSPLDDPYKIKSVIAPYEKVGFSVVGGMVFTELTDQTLGEAFKVDPTLGSMLLPENRMKSTLILTHVFGHSQAFRNRTIGSGSLLRRVNGQEVSTSAELNQVISQASTRKDFTFSFNHHRKVFLSPHVMYEELRVVDEQNVTIHDGVRQWMANWTKAKQQQNKNLVKDGTDSLDVAHMAPPVDLEQQQVVLHHQSPPESLVEEVKNLEPIQRHEAKPIQKINQSDFIPRIQTVFTTQPIVAKPQIQDCEQETEVLDEFDQETEVLDEFDQEMIENLLPFHYDSTFI